MRPASAKIIQHAEGLGLPNAELVRKRAEELAQIDGRTEFTERDWQDARRELHGGHDNLVSNGSVDMAVLVSEHDMITSDAGHHVAKLGPEDDGNIVEELISEGMDEAVHDQMLAAAQAGAAELEDEE